MRNPSSSSSKTTPCCSKVGIKRGPWTSDEDEILTSYIKREGYGAWRTLPKRAGLLRCGKSCRLRWMNYLRPHLNRGPISEDEEDLILRLHRLLGNRWSLIAGRIPGRTDNEIKNYWNTHLSKKLISQGLDPRTHKPLEIYNPNPNNHNSNKEEEVIYGRSSDEVEDCIDGVPNPNPNRASPPVMMSHEDHVGASEGMIMEGYNEEMYFSSFLDSLIMNEECVFQQPDDQQLVSNFNNNHLMIQEPMVYESNNSHQGVIWGSDHEVSPLMASGLSNSQRVQGSRNLDPGAVESI